MNFEEIKEILDTVDKLNDYLSDDLVNKYGLSFVYETNGWWHGIKIFDLCLWDTENELREWIDEENKYEPLYPVVLDEFMKIATMFGNLERINKIKQLTK